MKTNAIQHSHWWEILIVWHFPCSLCVVLVDVQFSIRFNSIYVWHDDSSKHILVAPLFIYRLVFIPLKPQNWFDINQFNCLIILSEKTAYCCVKALVNLTHTSIWETEQTVFASSTYSLDIVRCLNSITIRPTCAHLPIISSATVFIIDDDHDCDICKWISMQKIATQYCSLVAFLFRVRLKIGK